MWSNVVLVERLGEFTMMILHSVSFINYHVFPAYLQHHCIIISGLWIYICSENTQDIHIYRCTQLHELYTQYERMLQIVTDYVHVTIISMD